MYLSPKHFTLFSQLSLLLFLFACKSESSINHQAFKKEVSQLKTLEDKTTYLDHIYTDFVESTKLSDQTMDLFGINSEEHLKQKKIYTKVAKESEGKINAFLNSFGYPSLMKLGRKAAFAPWVITYRSDNLKFKKSTFKYLYDAYVFGDIDDELFLVYLRDMHFRLEKFDYNSHSNETTTESIEAIMQLLKTDSW